MACKPESHGHAWHVSWGDKPMQHWIDLHKTYNLCHVSIFPDSGQLLVINVR